MPVADGGYRLHLARDSDALTGLGFRNGDIIVAIDGAPVTEANAVERAVRRGMTGETLRVTIRRDGETLTLMPDVGALDGQ